MIQFHYEAIEWRLDHESEVSAWLELTARHHGFAILEINYIFADDEYVLYLNQKYLQHDTYTDILTFDYSVPGSKQLVADIYISVPRVVENAATYVSAQVDEFHRVMVHGLLHLVGYLDSTDGESAVMRQQEDFALSLRMF
jgi:rRNA maturation RNase YbeY